MSRWIALHQKEEQLAVLSVLASMVPVDDNAQLRPSMRVHGCLLRRLRTLKGFQL